MFCTPHGGAKDTCIHKERACDSISGYIYIRLPKTTKKRKIENQMREHVSISQYMITQKTLTTKKFVHKNDCLDFCSIKANNE